MSKVENNPLLRGVSGMIGGTIIFRTVRGQQQMVNRPKKRAGTTDKQKVVTDKFKRASQYASRQIAQKASLALYQEGVTQKKHTPYLVAMSDYLISPEVANINFLSYDGKVGDVIVVTATDDFEVTAVKIIITAADGMEIEKGDAGPDLEQINQWAYKATKANLSLAGTVIRAVAFDRPGNSAALERVL